MTNLAEKNPLVAKEFLEKIASPDILKSGIEAIMRPWAKSNPSDAISFFEKHQELLGARKETAISQIANGWAFKNPAKALKWAAGLEDAALRETAIRGAETTWAQNDPAAAAEAGVLEQAADWISHDPKAAETWIKSLQPHRQIKGASLQLSAHHCQRILRPVALPCHSRQSPMPHHIPDGLLK